MKEYHDLLRRILREGVRREDRTGIGTLEIFGHQMQFPLSPFPLLTTKKLHFHSIVQELFWFLRGETNLSSLQAEGVRIWDPWADAQGDLGPIYGKQWRRWSGENGKTIDQLSDVIEEIKNSPTSRRLVVSAWNPSDLPAMALPPCHCLFQFWVSEGKLSCQLYQRSADCFLGLPFNIASYALLTHLVARATGLEVGRFVHSLGAAHLYLNHLPQVEEQLMRSPRPLPSLRLRPGIKDLFAFRAADVEVEGYDPFPGLKGKIAV